MILHKELIEHFCWYESQKNSPDIPIAEQELQVSWELADMAKYMQKTVTALGSVTPH